MTPAERTPVSSACCRTWCSLLCKRRKNILEVERSSCSSCRRRTASKDQLHDRSAHDLKRCIHERSSFRQHRYPDRCTARKWPQPYRRSSECWRVVSRTQKYGENRCNRVAIVDFLQKLPFLKLKAQTGKQKVWRCKGMRPLYCFTPSGSGEERNGCKCRDMSFGSSGNSCNEMLWKAEPRGESHMSVHLRCLPRSLAGLGVSTLKLHSNLFHFQNSEMSSPIVPLRKTKTFHFLSFELSAHFPGTRKLSQKDLS